ncbi:MAG: ribosome silencing factor [Candidatus Gastranaerophilales bacterium]|nr:ribosome silencing factor [Candidatus Gastranaerophilales bacterium]MCM1073902.1 ribosome silencing factor [Bacteroides sp.]
MTEELTSYKFACVVARVLDEKIAKDISILNISNVSSFADYFVIASAQTSTQVKALTENLADKVKQTFSRLPHGKENDAKNRWNLIDYGDVVVHILHQDDRDAYAIEKFWNHAFSVPRETWLKESEEYSEYKV